MSNLTKHVQNSIVYLLVTDTDFCKIAASQIPLEVFTSEVVRKIAEICVNYFNDYKEAPRKHFNDILLNNISDYAPEKKELYLEYLTSLNELDEPNKEYIINRLNPFIRHAIYEKGLLDIADCISEGDYTSADIFMHNMLNTGIKKPEDDFFYLENYDGVYHREDEEVYDMKTGIDALDYLIGGYKKKQLIVKIGGYKGYKTFSLLHDAVQALRQGKNVIFFSHEVTKEEIELRLDMMISSRSSRRIGEIETVPYYDVTTDKMLTRDFERRSVYEKEPVIKARKALGRMGGRFIIKKYPMGTCSLQEMESYLNYLEDFHGFTPDLIITDYVEIMDISNLANDSRDRINQAYIRLKGMADERNSIVMTASQVTTAVLQREKITMRDLAEDRRKSGNVDLAIAISSNSEKDRNHIGRLSIVAGRSVEDGTSCSFSHCIPCGQFHVSSWLNHNHDDEFLDTFSDSLLD